MQGRRVYPDEEGILYLAEGDYGQHKSGEWLFRPPGCAAGSGRDHDVTEHEDKTITVSPSILLTEFDGDGNEREIWHGYLERGIWREV